MVRRKTYAVIKNKEKNKKLAFEKNWNFINPIELRQQVQNAHFASVIEINMMSTYLLIFSD